MQRPTRTRRLSIAAMVSLAAFAVVAGADVRCFWNYDIWQTVSKKGGCAIILGRGCAVFARRSGAALPGAIPIMRRGHTHLDYQPHRSDILESFWNFKIQNGAGLKPSYGSMFAFGGPVWPLLLLLLIIPIRWLIARPANASAFPIITEPKQPYPRDAIPLMRDQKPKRD